MARRERAAADDVRGGAGAAYRAALGSMLAAGYRAAARGAIATVLAASLGAFAALLAAEALLGGWRLFPLAAFVVFWGAVAAAVALRARRPVPAWRARDLAADLDRRLESVNLLTAALEFSERGERAEAYSPHLLELTVRRGRERLAAVDARALFAPWARPGWAAAGVALGALVAIETLLFGAGAVRLSRAIVDPAGALRGASLYHIVAISGDRLVLPGDSVVVEAVGFGARGGDAALRLSSVPGVWSERPVRGEREIADGVAVTVYRHTLRDVREDLSYVFAAGRNSTREHRVRVIRRPVVNRIAAVLVPPRYAGAPPDTLDPLAGRIVALAGTRIELAAQTSATPRRGWVRFASGARLPVRPRERGFDAAFAVVAADTFSVEIVDSLGYANESPVRYPVAALADEPPSIEIAAPADGAQLPRSMGTDLVYRAADDYGVSRVTLRWMRDGKDEAFRATQLRLPGGPGAEIEGTHAWSLAEANVFPGDRVLYYLEAADNNTATGPGISRTETRRLVVPSVSEIYARARENEAKRSEDLRDVVEEGREIEKRLRKLSDDLKTEGRLDWSRKREGEAVVEKQRALQDKMREITGELQRSLDEMERDRAASRDVGDKLAEIRELMKRIESEDLREAIESLQKLLREMPAEQLLPAMNQAQMDMAKLLENMDRAIELLKQVLREEKMDEMTRRAEEMLANQRSLRDSTARGDTDRLSGRQKDLGEESSAYEKDLEKLARDQADSTLAAELERARREMERSNTTGEMQKASEQLSRGERESAQCSQQNAVDGLLSLFTRMTSCKNAMGLTIDREVAEAIARSARELVETSKLQERLAARLGDAGAGRDEGLIREQLVVKGAVDRITANLHEAGRKTLALSPMVYVQLGLARTHIDEALAGLDAGRASRTADASAQALLAINLASIELLRSSSSMGGKGGGGGTQAMQQLLQQQLSLREQLMEMLQRGREGQWSMQERAGMARLAAEQRSMEETMERIAEESRGTNELMGKLDDLAGRMEEIAKRLEEGELDRELLDRQEQIISRMLDSQRSMRERDYKRERTSTAAADVAPLAPDGRRSPAEERELLLRMIRRGMREKGPAEYEELIRRYFRALSEKAREGE